MKKCILAIAMFFVCASASAQTSGVFCEVWSNRTLVDPSQLAVNPNLLGAPTYVEIFTGGFVAATDRAGAPFVVRCTAKLVIPVTANYLFKITANKLATLWISPTMNITRITHSCRVSAAFPTPTALQWDKNLEQKSSFVARTAGGTYYATVIQVATSGTNHLAVGWQQSTLAFEQPIPASQLQQPLPPPAVSVLLETDKLSMVQGAAARLTWSTTNATSCIASSVPAYQYWTGTKAISGNQYVTPLISATLTLTCLSSVSSGAATLSVTVTPADELIPASRILTIAFDSLDHETIEGYVLGFYLIGAVAPFQTMDLGKPVAVPPYTGIGVYLGSLPSGGLVSWPLEVGQYQLRVTARQGGMTAISEPSPTYAVVK